MAQNRCFSIYLENQTCKLADFLIEGRGTLVEKTNEGYYSRKIQNWGFWTFFVVLVLGCTCDVRGLSALSMSVVVFIFLYSRGSDECGGYYICNIMSMMSGHVLSLQF